MGMYRKYQIAPIITKKTLNAYKNDEFYVMQLEFIDKCKALSTDDMELKHIIAYVEKAVDLIFFSKHNRCAIYYDQENMLDRVLKPLENYVQARYYDANNKRFDAK